MVEIAKPIIDQLEGLFEPGMLRNHYEKWFRGLIGRNGQAAKPSVVAPPPEPSNVIDLMAEEKPGAKLGTRPLCSKFEVTRWRQHQKRARVRPAVRPLWSCSHRGQREGGVASGPEASADAHVT
jgi:non-homologous end joining protein Ku